MQNFSAQLVSMNQVYCSRNSFLSNEKGFYVIKKMFHMQCLLENIFKKFQKFSWFFDQIIFEIFAKFFGFKVFYFLYSENMPQVSLM